MKPPSEYFGALPGFTDPAREYNERAFGDLNGREVKAQCLTGLTNGRATQ